MYSIMAKTNSGSKPTSTPSGVPKNNPSKPVIIERKNNIPPYVGPKPPSKGGDK